MYIRILMKLLVFAMALILTGMFAESTINTQDNGKRFILSIGTLLFFGAAMFMAFYS